MLGEIGGTNQSKVLTNNFLLLLVALLFLVLAFLLKLRGGKKRWRFYWGKALLLPKVHRSGDAAWPHPLAKPRSALESSLCSQIIRSLGVGFWCQRSRCWKRIGTSERVCAWVWAGGTLALMRKKGFFLWTEADPTPKHVISWASTASSPGHSAPVLGTTRTITWDIPNMNLGEFFGLFRRMGLLGLIFLITCC